MSDRALQINVLNIELGSTELKNHGCLEYSGPSKVRVPAEGSKLATVNGIFSLSLFLSSFLFFLQEGMS